MKINNSNERINSLIEKGLLFESESLTPRGRIHVQEMLQKPEVLKEYLTLANQLFSEYPVPQRKILWKRLLKNLKETRDRERSLNANFVKD